MRLPRAIAFLDVLAYGVMVPICVAASLISLLHGNALGSLPPLIWGTLAIFNWREFKSWRRGQHRLILASAKDRDEFSRQVFLMKATAASRYASQVAGLGLRKDEPARRQLQALYLAVAMHELPADAEPQLIHLRDSAAAVARGGEARELLH